MGWIHAKDGDYVAPTLFQAATLKYSPCAQAPRELLRYLRWDQTCEINLLEISRLTAWLPCMMMCTVLYELLPLFCLITNLKMALNNQIR